MYAKKIKATDFNGVEREETFYFNLTEAELAEWQMSESGGLKGILEKIVETTNEPDIINFFKEVICKSYGEKSNDGKFFKKEDPMRGKYYYDFVATEFYNTLFMELATDTNSASEFINGIVPAKFKSELAEQQAKHPVIESK